MILKFLGTGAADWTGPDERGEYRRCTSTLLDGCLLIDITKTALDMIPDPVEAAEAEAAAEAVEVEAEVEEAE